MTSPSGATRKSTAPPSLPTAELLAELIEYFRLARENEKGKAIEWGIYRNNGKDRLDTKKTLAQNGVVSGDSLLIRAKASPVPWLPIGAAILAVLVAGALGARKLFAPPKPVVVRVMADKASVAATQTASFHASVENASNPAVRWSLDPAIGSVTAAGVYSAPATISSQQVVEVKATSVQDPSKSGKAEVTLLPEAISLSPQSASLGPSESTQFLATLRPDAGTSVKWTLDPDVGTVTAAGVYTAPNIVSSAETVTLTATSEQNPQYSAKATISISSSPPLHVVPGAATLAASDTRQFTLKPDTGSAAQWHLHPQIGSISPGGLYTAPGLIDAPVKVTISATADGMDKAAVATISLQPVAIGPVVCNPGANHQFNCQTRVANARNTAVNWSVEPGFGSISAQGVYTPPPVVEKARSIAVIAVSKADPRASGRSTFVVPQNGPEVAVKINSFRDVLTANQKENFTATLAPPDPRGVTWSASLEGNYPDAQSLVGKMLPNGLYIAPANVPAGGVRVRITASSNSNPSRSDSVELTLRPGGNAERVAVAPGVMAARLISGTPPQYPAGVNPKKNKGPVILQVVISKTGTVESVSVVSGPPPLQQAAMDAVRAWRYQPYLLNGMPVEVATQVELVFKPKG